MHYIETHPEILLESSWIGGI